MCIRRALALRELSPSPRNVSSVDTPGQGAPVPLGAQVCYFCGAANGGSGRKSAGRVGSPGQPQPISPRWLCPKCGTDVARGRLGAAPDRCDKCGIPLSERALTSVILDVSRRTGPLLNAGTGLAASAFVFLLGLLAYGSPLFTALPGTVVPPSALEELLGVVGLFVLGGALSGIASRMNRRELRQRGIDSPQTRSAAQAFFPRYAVSRLIRSGRLDLPKPVRRERSDGAVGTG